MSKVYTTVPYDVILSALEKLEAYIAPTYGPNGRGILVDRGMYQDMLDDGYLAIDEFELPDPLENAVIKFVKEASAKINKRAGDGTTTGTLLMIAIVRECLRSGSLRSDMLVDLSIGSNEAIGLISQSKRTISSEDDLLNVAFNAYGDGDSAEIVSSVVKQVGSDGVITVEAGEALTTTSDVVMGMSIKSGFYSPYFGNQDGKVELENPSILITTRRITTNKEILPILRRMMENKQRDLLIVAEDVQGEALTTLVMNKIKGVFNVQIAKATFSDTRKLDFLEDLGAITGATVIDDAAGIALENIGLGALGHADKVIVSALETIVVGGKGDVSERIASVRTLLDEQPNNDAIAARLARLTGGVGVIKVGAATEAEMKTKKAKIDDAVHAAQLAYKTGVVKGAAQALIVETSSKELNAALKYPREVLENNSRDLNDDVEDAFGVIEAAIESGVSLATLLLNCGGIITNDEKNSSSAA